MKLKKLWTNLQILEFISILQFSQMHLTFENNVSKEIKKMIAKNFNVLQFSEFWSTQRFLDAIMLFALICTHALTLRSQRSTGLPTPDHIIRKKTHSPLGKQRSLIWSI